MRSQNPVNSRRRSRLLFGLAITAVAITSARAGGAADAQDALQEVIVTGSRLVSPNMTSTSPVQAISNEDIRTGGRADITDVLNNLPQVQTNHQGSGLGNRSSGLTSAGGVANVDLRGLGPNRTLVLVNGRRLGVGSPNTKIAAPAPDIDQIPSALLERIDVLTGGASAVYGSDAVAGVVNFITRRDFTGLQLDYKTSQFFHENDSGYAAMLLADTPFTPPASRARDGKNTNLSLTMGADLADGMGNVTAFFGYLKNHSVRSAGRDFGGCQMFMLPTLDDLFCSGTANSNYFRLTSPGTSPEYQVSGSSFVPWGSVPASVPPPIYNSQSLIYFGRDNTRINAGFMANLDINEGVRPYAEFMFMNDKSRQEIAPSGLFRDQNPLSATGGYLVNCSNPLLSAQQRALICTPAQITADTAVPGSANADLRIGRRNLEGGGRQNNYEHTNYRGVVGLRGDLFPGWSYDAYGQYYFTSFLEARNAYLNLQSIANSLQVRGTAAAPVCISGPPCVPYDIFTEGAVTDAMLNYLYTPGTSSGNISLRTVHGDISADLGQYGVRSPLAEGGIRINFGYEYRSEHHKFAPDAAQLSGLLAGAGGASVALDDTLSVQEEFVELLVPLAQDKAFVHELLFDAGYRYSDYSTGIDTNTYKFQLQYAPTSAVRLRGGYQRAIRAPSILELFKPQDVGQVQVGADPCAPTIVGGVLVAAAATQAQCALSGVTAAQYGGGFGVPQGTASQLTQSQGGNPDLNAETADTYAVGFVLTPEGLPGFNASVDYFSIEVKDQINTLPANVILAECSFRGDPFYCAQLKRSPATGGLTGASVASGGYIVQTNVNVGAAKVEGIDLQTGYRFDMPVGALRLALYGTYTLSTTTTPFPGAHTYDCAGLYGPVCQGIRPEWSHSMRGTWELPASVNVSLTWRHLGSTKLDNNDPDETLNHSSFDGDVTYNATLPAYHYIDVAASWNPRDWITVRGGINNLFDKTPPILPTELIAGGAANTLEAYDPLGMMVFAGVTLKF